MLQFIEARIRGEAPDLDVFVKQHPDLEQDIRRRIASFGMVDSLLDRWVAVKTIPNHLIKDEATKARFHREAKLLAALNHPNIAAIHDMIEPDDGTCYLVLEYVPGRTLTQYITNRPLKLRDALSIARQIAEALAAAYEKGIIHRDLKPGNVKIMPDGKVKVLDFGIAKVCRPVSEIPETAVTQEGHLVGTPAYMSPEQARGKQIDHRTDIWSFGHYPSPIPTNGRCPFMDQKTSFII